MLASSSDDHRVRIWNIADTNLVYELPTQYPCSSVAWDAYSVWIACNPDTLQWFDLQTKMVHSIQVKTASYIEHIEAVKDKLVV